MCTIMAGEEQSRIHITSVTCDQGLVPLGPVGSKQASKYCIQEENSEP